MCGRYSLIANIGKLAGRFEFDGDWVKFESRFNVAPIQEVLTVVGDETGRTHALGTNSVLGQGPEDRS